MYVCVCILCICLIKVYKMKASSSTYLFIGLVGFLIFHLKIFSEFQVDYQAILMYTCNAFCDGILQSPINPSTHPSLSPRSLSSTVGFNSSHVFNSTKDAKTDHLHGDTVPLWCCRRTVKGTISQCNINRMKLISINFSGLVPKSCSRIRPDMRFTALQHQIVNLDYCSSRLLSVSSSFTMYVMLATTPASHTFGNSWRHTQTCASHRPH